MAEIPTTKPLYQTVAILGVNMVPSIRDAAIESGWEWKRTGANIMWRKHISGPINHDDGEWRATSI